MDFLYYLLYTTSAMLMKNSNCYFSAPKSDAKRCTYLFCLPTDFSDVDRNVVCKNVLIVNVFFSTLILMHPTT